MRVLFIGGTKRGYLTLQALVDSRAEMVGVLSLAQAEHETERYETSIRQLAESHGLPLYETRWLKDRDYAALLSNEIQPDLAIVIGCRILIPPEIYRIPPLGTLAVHDSLLPEYRGFAPLNWSILNGEDRTGVTLFYLGEQMDGGDIVAQKVVPIGETETASEVYERICQATVDVVLESLPRFADGSAAHFKQNYSEGSFTCSRSPDDGLIEWSKTTKEISNQIRALTNPYPGAFTFYRGHKLLIWRAQELDDAPRYVGRIPGRVVGLSHALGTVDVLTGDGVLRIKQVQLEGNDLTQASQVIRSVRDHLGLGTLDLLRRIEVLEQVIANMKRGDRNGS